MSTLTISNRIIRSSQDPVFEKPILKGRSTVRAIEHHGLLGAITLQQSKTRLSYLDQDMKDIQHREHRALLFANDLHIGSFKATEYVLPPEMDWDDFHESADMHSDDLTELAQVLSGNWDHLDDLTELGSMISFDRLWIAPHAANAVMFRLATQAFVQAIRGGGVLALKAFPIEYERREVESNSPRFISRQQALMRRYRSILGVKPFPELDGTQGWMYAIRVPR